MLPPVLASTSSYVPATEARLRPQQVATAPQPVATPQPVRSGEISQNPAIAGQLNIMMLSGPERMSQNLAALADVLGGALKIDRQPDEGLGDYMARLIEGISNLPAADRLKLQKLLTQVFAGLQLRTLLEAMANPSGPERATLALYLELYRQPDRDGAARSVISSYREVAAETRANPLAPARPLPANDSVRQGGEAVRQDQRPLQQAPSVPQIGGPDGKPAERPLPTSPPLGRADLQSVGPQPGRYSATGQLQPTNDPPDARPALAPKLAGQEPVTETQRSGRAVQSTSTADSGRPRSIDQLAGTPRDRATNRTDAPSTTDADGKNRSPGATPPADLAAVGAKPVQPLPPAWLAELIESNLVRTLLQLRTLSAGQPDMPGVNRPDQGETEATILPEDAQASAAASEKDAQPSASATATSRDTLTDDHPLPPVLIPAEQTFVRPVTAREGVPLPFVLYGIEDEIRPEDVEAEEKREDAEEKHRQKGEERPDDDAVASAPEETMTAGTPEGAEQAPLSHAIDGPDERQEKTLALPAPTPVALKLPPEPAHELYLRMAGLT